MAVTLQRMTVEARDLVPQEREGDRHELIAGELIVTPSPIPFHQLVSGRLTLKLGNLIEVDDLGVLFTAPIDVFFSPHDLVVPIWSSSAATG
jgi:Uma2 family endonuclease